ncbi:hypothetical protein L596_025436 [Steinernema carpocapsae]|uniref:HMG box domain-containing protein n=1 Tax=Steinernema carpocapsae TaxID=34508 RepID=A0A4U5M7S5_STECR|nr:hypothetical protein L596_025436 [Steinernema carpocapsae]
MCLRRKKLKASSDSNRKIVDSSRPAQSSRGSSDQTQKEKNGKSPMTKSLHRKPEGEMPPAVSPVERPSEEFQKKHQKKRSRKPAAKEKPKKPVEDEEDDVRLKEIKKELEKENLSEKQRKAKAAEERKSRYEKQMLRNPFYKPKLSSDENLPEVIKPAKTLGPKANVGSPGDSKGKSMQGNIDTARLPRPKMPDSASEPSARAEWRSKEILQDEIESDLAFYQTDSPHDLPTPGQQASVKPDCYPSRCRRRATPPGSTRTGRQPTALPEKKRSQKEKTEKSEHAEIQESGCNLELNASEIERAGRRRRRLQKKEDNTLYEVDPKMPEKDFSECKLLSDNEAFAKARIASKKPFMSK